MRRPDRRTFLRSAAAFSGSAFGLVGLQRLAACAAQPDTLAAGLGDGGYGPLRAAGDELELPEGFQYVRFGVEGSPMSDGTLTPRAHDGMAAFPLPNGHIRLVRNHEDNEAAETARPRAWPAYDEAAGGGTVSLEVHPETRELIRDFNSLNGTLVNCAGGPTPWRSWLSCEEITWGPEKGFQRPHGYVFEVPAGSEVPVDPVPLRAMGRFQHEAIAVDPGTGILYLTEDNDEGAASGFYRFLAEQPGAGGAPANLRAGGRLEMLAIVGSPRYDTRRGQVAAPPFPVEWVPITEPDPSAAAENPSAVVEEGSQAGGAHFARLEGCWFGGRTVYFNATAGGDIGLGQIWAYQPGRETLRLVFESTDPAVLKKPDNICVSPRGGLVVCEDPPANAFMRGLTRDGRIFDLARNTLNNREFAGATFSPDGRTLFVNIQGDLAPGGPGNLGMTFAIWGPWEQGAL